MTDSQVSPTDIDAGSRAHQTLPATSESHAKPESIAGRAGEVLDAQSAKTGTRWIARAPGRLDVFGGIAEYTGAAVVSYPLADGVTVTVQLRDDSRIDLIGLGKFAGLEGQPITFHPGDLIDKSPQQFASELPDVPWVRAAAGAILAIVVTGKIDGDVPGVTVAIDSSLPDLVDAGVTASVAVAVLSALIPAWNLKFDAAECAHLATRAENDVVGMPRGPAAALSALHARRGSLISISCPKGNVGEQLALPNDLAIIGIDSGGNCPGGLRRYSEVRCATFMGRVMIDRIVEAYGLKKVNWTGSLSQLSNLEYNSHFRDRMPKRIRGRDFIKHFGSHRDSATTIDPDVIYKPPSRTEHHIHDAERSRQFFNFLTRYERNRDREMLIRAGELMYGSHWSYSQRCAIANVETDCLVKLLRGHGIASGIFGSRLSDSGAGGIVVVLMENSKTAHNAVNDVISEYEREFPNKAAILAGTSSGTLEHGLLKE